MPLAARLILKNTPEDVLAVSFSDEAACRQLLSLLTPIPRTNYTIWLTQIEQIHRFVYQIPNLAWELMDYATEPLSLVYQRPKPIFSDQQVPEEVCIRLVNEAPLRKELPRQQSWLTTTLEELLSGFGVEDWIEKEVDMGRKMKGVRPVKVLRVYENGEFSFLP